MSRAFTRLLMVLCILGGALTGLVIASTPEDVQYLGYSITCDKPYTEATRDPVYDGDTYKYQIARACQEKSIAPMVKAIVVGGAGTIVGLIFFAYGEWFLRPAQPYYRGRGNWPLV